MDRGRIRSGEFRRDRRSGGMWPTSIGGVLSARYRADSECGRVLWISAMLIVIGRLLFLSDCELEG